MAKKNVSKPKTVKEVKPAVYGKTLAEIKKEQAEKKPAPVTMVTA